jgi:hypothetical protein
MLGRALALEPNPVGAAARGDRSNPGGALTAPIPISAILLKARRSPTHRFRCTQKSLPAACQFNHNGQSDNERDKKQREKQKEKKHEFNVHANR